MIDYDQSWIGNFDGIHQVFCQPKPRLKNASEVHLLCEYSLLVHSAWLSLQSLFTIHLISSFTSLIWNTAVRGSDWPVFWLPYIHFCISCSRDISITNLTLPGISDTYVHFGIHQQSHRTRGNIQGPLNISD
jgi:hypothetical protein